MSRWNNQQASLLKEILISRIESFSLPDVILVGQGQKTWAVGKVVIGVTVGARASSLVEQLKVAWIDWFGLISAATDKIAAANILAPGSTTIGIACEGIRLSTSLSSPRAA